MANETAPRNIQKANGVQPVKKTRMSDNVVVQLTKMILSGEIEPGTRLPPERDLAPRFFITRTTLREAFRKMETMGLVRIRQGDGIYPEDYTLNSTLEFVKFISESGLGLDKEFIKALEETRRIFATILVELAARRITPESVERLEKLVEECPSDNSPELMSGDWDFRFYREITLAANNRVLLYILNSFKDFFRITRWIYCRLDQEQGESLKEMNGKLVEALKEKDSEAAVRLVKSRMEKDAETLSALLDTMGDSDRFTIP